MGPPIAVGRVPFGIAITPDGKTAYVANIYSNDVSVIDTETNQVVGPAIAVGQDTHSLAITPDGRFVYVTNTYSNVSVIDTQTNEVVGSPIDVTLAVSGIAITPDGKTVYIDSENWGSVSMIDTQTNQLVGSPILGVGSAPFGIAFTPNGKTAYVVNNGGYGNVSVIDTQTNEVVGSPIVAGRGPHEIAIAPETQSVGVQYVPVRLACPSGAQPAGCRFKLQAITARRKGIAQSAVAKASIRAAHSKIVSLKPRRAFRAKLAVAQRVLVRVRGTIDGYERTRFRELKVVR